MTRATEPQGRKVRHAASATRREHPVRSMAHHMAYSEALDRGLRRNGSNLSEYHGWEDELADQLGLRVETLGELATDVLSELLRVLSDDLEDHGPWDWRRDIEEGRHRRIASHVVKHQTIDVLVAAAHQFGWQRRKVQATSFSDVEKGVRNAFTALLADPIAKMLDTWRRGNVWNHEMETRFQRMARQRREDEKKSQSTPPS